MLFYFFQGRNGRAGIDQIGRISAVLFMETVFHNKVRKNYVYAGTEAVCFGLFFFRGGHGPAGGRGSKTVPALSMTVFYQI